MEKIKDILGSISNIYTRSSVSLDSLILKKSCHMLNISSQALIIVLWMCDESHDVYRMSRVIHYTLISYITHASNNYITIIIILYIYIYVLYILYYYVILYIRSITVYNDYWYIIIQNICRIFQSDLIENTSFACQLCNYIKKLMYIFVFLI